MLVHKTSQRASFFDGTKDDCVFVVNTTLLQEKAKEILDMFCTWGINRFSISWLAEDMRDFFDQMDQWGFEVNIYNDPVPTLCQSNTT